MAVDKKFFVDINLQGNALNNVTIGSNSDMTKGGSFRYEAGGRLEYHNGSSVQEVANMSDISAVTGGLILQAGYDAATNTPDIADGNASKGFFWVVTEAGSFLGTSVQVGDSIIAKVDAAGASIGDWLILQGNIVTATDEVEGIVRLATQEEVDAGTEGGAVVLTPATFENSTQLSDIRSNISALETDKLSRDGSQAMEGSLDMGGNDITNVNETATANLSGIAGADISLQNNINGNGVSNLVNIPAPTNGGDAANKDYVDTAASTAQSNAEATASADATAKADAAQAAAESYADGLAVNYDAAGSAAQALTDANSYTNTQIDAQSFTALVDGTQNPTSGWTYDATLGVYKATITHNLGLYVALSTWYDGFPADFSGELSNNSYTIYSNIEPFYNTALTFVKATGNL